MRLRLYLVILGCVYFAGCSREPTVDLPSLVPDEAAAKAVELLDKDGDGLLGDSELQDSPGLKSVMKRLDSDGDRKVSQAELSSHMNQWLEMQIGAVPATFMFTLKGKPLADATITFVPEPFLEDAISIAEGVTNASGTVFPSSSAVKRGMQVGFYRVKISKKANGIESIPAQYNENTTIGAEVSSASPAVNSIGQQIKL